MNTRAHVGIVALVLAGGLLAAAARAESPAVADLIQQTHSTSEADRIAAANHLATLGPKAAEAVASLTALLKDPSPAVRVRALRALRHIGDAAKSAAPELIKALADADPKVRQGAVHALAVIKPGPQVTIPLFVKLMEDSDPVMRTHVLQELADVGAPAVPALIEALKNEKAAYWALLVLRDIGAAAKDAVPALSDKLSDARPEIRRETLLALAAIGQPAAPAVKAIGGLIGDRQQAVAAIYALGSIGQIPADVDAKLRENGKSKDVMVRNVSLWALARVHLEDKDLRREATERLIEGLKDANPHVRATAAQGLASLPPAPEITAPIWEKALKDADETTLQHALDALAGLGAPAVPRLIDALKYPHARQAAVYILGQIGPPAAAATAELAKLVADKHPDLATEAAIALAKIGPAAADAVPALVQALESTPDEAHAVIYALGKIGPKAAAADAGLRKTLAHGDPSLAVSSAWALNHIHPGSKEVAQQTLPVLVGGLSSPLVASRVAAADALGELGALAVSAQPALEKATHDDDAAVREAATSALKAVAAPAKADNSSPPAPAVPAETKPAAKPVEAPKAAETPQAVEAPKPTEMPKAVVAEAPKPAETPQPADVPKAAKPAEASAPPAVVEIILVTKYDGVPLQIGNSVLRRIAKGTRVKVLDERGEWVGVEVKVDEKSTVLGWVPKMHLDKP